MKKFRIIYSGKGSVVVKAESEDAAEKMFLEKEMYLDGEVDFDGAMIDSIEEVTEGDANTSEVTESGTES